MESNTTKVAFVVTSHWSDEIRPQGGDLLTRYLDSIYNHCIFPYEVYVVDNQSQYKLPIDSYPNLHYIRIEDQYKKGLTGAWNVGINKAYEDGCDIIFNCNDDLFFSESINQLITYIQEDYSADLVYSTVTNGILPGPFESQRSEKALEGRKTLAFSAWNSVLNGFFFGFTREHYEAYRFEEDSYFPLKHKNDQGDGKWGGQEGYWVELGHKGVRGLVYRDIFVEHTKLRAWKTAKRIDNES